MARGGLSAAEGEESEAASRPASERAGEQGGQAASRTTGEGKVSEAPPGPAGEQPGNVAGEREVSKAAGEQEPSNAAGSPEAGKAAESQQASAAESGPVGQKDHPAFRLITIPISHYCEKARWALDRAHVPYREERHVQGIHRIASRRAGGRGTVPVLVTPDGVIADSSEILEWADERQPAERRLFASEASARGREEALCVRFDEVLGPAGRRLIYVRMFEHPAPLARRFNNAGIPRWEDLLSRVAWARMRRVVASSLGIRPGIEVQDEETVFRELDNAQRLLADGRPYLMGERFGAADLTFAALCAPIVLPERYGTQLPRPEELDEPTRELVRRAREHPAGAFALRVIAEQRPAPAGSQPAFDPRGAGGTAHSVPL